MRHRLVNLAWIFYEKFSLIGLSIGSFMVFALLLGPEQFGLGVLAVTLVEAIGIIYCSIIEDPLVRRTRCSKSLYASVFCFGGLLALGSATMLVAGSLLFGASELFIGLVALAGVKLVATVLSRPFVADLRRKRNFKSLANRTLAGKLIGTTVGILAALWGAGAWAVVLQAVMMETVSLILLLYWHHDLVSSKADIHRFGLIFRAGLPLGVKMFSRGMLVRAITLVLGMVSDATTVGYFAFANRLVDLPRLALSDGLLSYALPAIAKRANQGPDVGRFVSSISLSTTTLLAPLFLGAMVLGGDLIHLLFDAKWQLAITPFQCLCLLAALRCLVLYVPATLIALGKARWGMEADLLLLLGALLITWLYGSEWGAMAAVAAMALQLSGDLLIKLYQLHKLFSPRWQPVLRDYGFVALAAVLMMASIELLRVPQFLPLPEVLMAIATGAAVYFLGLFTLRPGWARGLINSIKQG